MAAANSNTQASAEKENEDINGIVNVETFVNNEKFKLQNHPISTDYNEAVKIIGKGTPVNNLTLGTKETASIKVEAQIIDDGLVFRAFPATS